MFLKENILLAVAGLKANKVRSLLTMLGIIIGISSVIAIYSIGDAMTASVSNTMASIGANNISVNVVERDSQSRNVLGGTSNKKIDDEDLITREQIDCFVKRYFDEVAAVSLTCSGGSGKAKDGRLYSNVSITGVNNGYKAINDVKLLKGRFISDKDVDATRKVAVVSDKFAANMFRGNTDPLGKEINVYQADEIDTYIVIGVYKYEQTAMVAMGTTSEKDISTSLYIPVTTAQETADNANYSNFMIKTNTSVDNAEFTKTADKYFNSLYSNNASYKCSIVNMESMMSSATAMLGTIKLAISAIAAIALLVGGIGVMNIMLVSVTERTREIGTRKALGAKSKYIKMQFIVESIIICAIGGIIGVILGILVAAIGVKLLGATFTISVPIIFISVGFSMLIGVFFGYYPASKAAKLDPIEALRYE